MAGAYDVLIQEIHALEKHFSTVHIASTTDKENTRQRQVTFGASTAKPTTHTATTTLQSALAHAANVGKRGYVADPMETYSEPEIGVGDDE
jgi:hypothetical protein